MTQKVFDIDNAEDMALLWDILPDNIESIAKRRSGNFLHYNKRIEITFKDKSQW